MNRSLDPNPTLAPSAESTLWRGSPSQALHLGTYLLCLLLCWLIVPLFIAAWRYIETRCHVYELTTERLRLRAGVFSKTTDDLELYRVRDLTLEEPFFLRFFGAGNIHMQTSDRTHPTFLMRAIPQAGEVAELLRRQVEIMRRAKGVRELDVE